MGWTRAFACWRASTEGIVAALNAGLEACRGQFLARMDADDIMHPRRLADQVALLSRESGLVLFSEVCSKSFASSSR